MRIIKSTTGSLKKFRDEVQDRIEELDSCSDVILSADDDLDHPDQEYDSAATSINSNKLPAIYKMIDFKPGKLYLDYGGGKFDNGIYYVKDLGATLLVYDPYNRSDEYNKETIRVARENGGADATICSNVLNVIKEPKARIAVLKNISRLTKSGGDVYITVYEGSGTGAEGPTKSGYQLNRKTAGYLEEVQSVFPDAVRKGKLIRATNSGVTSSTKIKSSTSLKRVARLGEFDNGHVLHDWEKMTDEEAENEARQMSIDHPGNVYYVAYDNVMDSSSDYSYKYGYRVDMLDRTKLLKMSEDDIRAIECSDVIGSFAPYQKDDLVKQIQDEVYNSASRYMQEEGGFTFSEVADYLIVEVEFTMDNFIKVEVRCEGDYDFLYELGKAIEEEVLVKYDKDAYFEPEQPGITIAFIDTENLVS